MICANIFTTKAKNVFPLYKKLFLIVLVRAFNIKHMPYTGVPYPTWLRVFMSAYVIIIPCRCFFSLSMEFK